MELVDTRDLKSLSNIVPVQVGPGARCNLMEEEKKIIQSYEEDSINF